MIFTRRGFFLMRLVFVTLSTLYLASYAKAATGEGVASQLNDEQRTGMRLYLQNCALCHRPVKKNNKNPEDLGTAIAPTLNGKFSGPKALPEAVARTFIQKGVPKKMPSFQYALEPNEINAIISYLKTL